MKVITHFLILFIVFVGVIFAYLNPDIIEINYLFSKQRLPLSVLIVLAIGLGLLGGLIFSFSVYWKMKRKQHFLKKELKKAQEEVDRIKILPENGPSWMQ